MTSLEPIADKLGKLLRMLASDRDGEVVAAVHAIKRTLASAKLDVHALADGIEAPSGKKFSEQEAREIYQHGVEEGRREAEGPVFRNVNLDEQPSWHEIATACAARPERLRNKETEFVADMVRWTVRGGKPTEKQAIWLRAIYVRVRR